MPQIPLTIGQMDLESDQPSRKGDVLANLYNGYRVGSAIHMWPDLAQYADLGTAAPVYTWYSVLHRKHFAVSGGNLYRIGIDGSVTEITGATLTVDTPPSFTEDRYHVFVAANSAIYQIDGDTAAALSGGQAPVNVTSLAFLSGFLVANGEDPAGGGLAGDFAYSDTQGEDGVPTYTEWNYENNASKPDGLQALVATSDDYLYAVGSQSVDVNYISGDVNNPFASNKAAAQQVGAVARYSITRDSSDIYFVGLSSDLGMTQVVKLVGGRSLQVIGAKISKVLDQIEDMSTAKAFMLSLFNSQAFYIITFPSANVYIDDQYHADLTLAYSLRSEEWYILGDWSEDLARYGAYRGVSYTFDGATGYIGGNDGKIYTLTTETRADDPQMLHRWRNNGEMEWRIGRELFLGTIGNRRIPLKSRMCGRYYKRQDELIFANGGTRMAIRMGWRDWGVMQEKLCKEYAYDVKRGDTGLVFNGIWEYPEKLSR